MADMPSGYHSRFDPDDQFEEHLFRSGRMLQSAELNEIQKNAAHRLKTVGDAIFRDGDIVRDASVAINVDDGLAYCDSGAIYIRGMVRGVAPATLAIPTSGHCKIGVTLTERVITEDDDPSLRDPANGQRAYNEGGAARLEAKLEWAVDGTLNFYPVYSITDGQLDPREPPPNAYMISMALAKYDRDSAGGSYIVRGMQVQQLPDSGGSQVYSMSDGECRVYGYPFEFRTSRRITYPAAPDLRSITNEPRLSSTASAQRVTFRRPPATNVSRVSITAEKTVVLTHGGFTGASDLLPDASVISLTEVRQGTTVFSETSDYLLTDGAVDWSPAGAEPATGSTYTVKYRYITTVTPTAVDDFGLTVTGAVPGTLILLDYDSKLPRIDRLCINRDGEIIWIKGVSSDYNPLPPPVPDGVLSIASVSQTWVSTRKVINNGVRTVPMNKLAAIDGRLDWLAQLIAQNRLESNIHTRESGTKIGLFTDPFINDSQRDMGTPQTGAIVGGMLQLPISPTIYQMGDDVDSPQTLPYIDAEALSQPLMTGSMQIDPYLLWEPVPGVMTLSPSVDRWTVVETNFASPVTERFTSGTGDQSEETESTRTVLLNTSVTAAETLRQIPVQFVIDGFGAGEILSSLTFDGIALPTSGLVANSNGRITGSFTIPAGVPTGSKLVAAVGMGGTTAQAVFSGQGTIERELFQEVRTITERRWQSPPPANQSIVRWAIDPIAQTFSMAESAQVSSVELWFTDMPTTRTLVQIRETSNGVPIQKVLAESSLDPDEIVADGSATVFRFGHPVMLQAEVEYAIVVICSDADGRVAVAQMGKFDADRQQWVTSQPYTIGVLLSSANTSTWSPHQDMDLKFVVNRASYTSNTLLINLGAVSVTDATDLMLMSYAERTDSVTEVVYTVALPDGSVIQADDGQPIQLPAPITGNISISALLKGSERFSPVLFPGSQLVVGKIGTSGTYVTRALPGGADITAKVILEANLPPGAALTIEYKLVGTSSWVTLPNDSTRQVDDGFVEYINSTTGLTTSNGVQFRVTITGSTAARPRVRDMRALVY